MQVLIIYYSMGGRTQKLAGDVARGVRSVEGAQCVIKSAEDVKKEDLIGSDALIAGSPSYSGTMASELKKVFEKNIGLRDKMCGKLGAAFACAAETPGGAETTILSIIQSMLIYGMLIAGVPSSTASGSYGAASVKGSLGEESTRDAFELGRRVALIASKLSK